MASCTPFPERPTTDTVYYISNVVLLPILYVIGVIGNALVVLICNTSVLRKEKAIFVYVCGLAASDAINFILATPTILRDIEVLSPSVSYSYVMTYARAGHYAFGNVFRQATLWLTAILGFMQYFFAGRPNSRSRLARSSSGRILIFAAVLFCCILNFPRFLEIEVYEIEGHCFPDLELWDWRIGDFGKHELFQLLFPWMILALSYIVPMLLILLAILLLWKRAGWKKLRTEDIVLVKALKEDARNFSISKSVWVILWLTFALELPSVTCLVLDRFVSFDSDRGSLFGSFIMASNFFSLVHSATTFFVLLLYCSDFRLGMRRGCCCLLPDDYREPIKCCHCCARKKKYRDRPKEKESYRPDSIEDSESFSVQPQIQPVDRLVDMSDISATQAGSVTSRSGNTSDTYSLDPRGRVASSQSGLLWV